MRLVCPNCGAQYEVPDEVIPHDGRDVQCSNCGDTWFQYHPSQEPDSPEDQALDASDIAPSPESHSAEAPAGAIEPDAPSQPSAPPAPRRELDPSVTDVLRQEAAREAAARAREADTLEEQPELGITPPDDEASRRQREASERKARMRGEDPTEAKAAAAMAASGSRRGVLPDIDEINSTLRKDSERRKTATEVAASRAATEQSGGFGRGFLTVVLLAAGLVALYVFAPRLAEAVPALAPALEAYVEAVNGARFWLDAQLKALTGE
ncbi:zinc-ribbon domain-containing protein [uncultured Lentibacter sp.]|uniref:zinc-ribbon domain-containing protein n=1 Tax=uncultured Lentibacter sp. TaxID=1659309 RepID=UPI00261FA819|nr:zinc-ribbon domain-containing protein [uncultured Lentibacter sp.]